MTEAKKPMQKWEHSMFWLREEAVLHSPKKKRATGDSEIRLPALTPVKKVRITEALREKANSIFRSYKDRTGEGRIYLPVRLVRPHKWFEPGHHFFIDMDKLDVAEDQQGSDG